MKKLESEIIIDASAREVWNVLMDFENYINWNPFIINLKGQAKKGNKIEASIKIKGQKTQVFTPNIIHIDKEREFRWLGHLFVKGLFDGEHYFKLEKINDHQTKLIHGENFTGVFSSVILNIIAENTLKGFNAMNVKLKEVCELKFVTH